MNGSMFIGIKYKYFFLYLLALIPVIILVNIISYRELTDRLREQTYAQHREIVKQANNALTLLKDSDLGVNITERNDQNVIILSLAESILGKNNEIILTDAEGNLIYTTNKHLFGKRLHLPVYESDTSEGYFQVRYLEVDRNLVYSFNPVTGWYLMVLTPVDNLATLTGYIESLMTIMIFTTTVVLILLIFLVTSRITSPISKLKRMLDKLERGDLESVRFKRDVLIRDEIWHIGISFNKILELLKESIHREYSYRMKSSEARLLALQSQINPHFLHNTLETINSIAILENVPLISELSRSLSKMFRYNTSHTGIFVKIEDELEHVENYLTVQLIRYDGMIRKDIRVDEDILQCYITKFVLQPIVENCFIHGFRDLSGDGLITITGYRKYGDIIIQVSDNGVGMTEEAIRALNREMASMDASVEHESALVRKRIGIFNVNNRIKMSFGPEYGVSVERNHPRGLTVKVRIPWRTRAHVQDDDRGGRALDSERH